MTAQVIPFTFQEHHPVRVTVIEGDPWFCLIDVCAVLEIKNNRRVAAEMLDGKGVRKTYAPTQGGEQELIFINEPNLYRVIFRSNKPEARQFQDWVFNEVLPAIRKTGSYEQPAPQPTLTGDQWKVIRDLIHRIELCCKWHGSANFAVNERIRFTYGLRSSSELRPEQFDETKDDLEGLKTLAEQHLDRMVTLDKEFIETVLRPPVSIRKIRAMAKKQGQQPPLQY